MNTKALRQKILDLAIRGKLVPQDPNDEPAFVFLEHIREQKKQMVKDGKLKAKDIKNDTIIFVGEDNLHYEKFHDGTVKCIENEIPFEVPEGWTWCRLNSIASFELGKTLDTAKNTGTYKPYLRSVNVRWNGIDLNDINHMKFEPNELVRYSVKKGDLLICEGGDVGRSCVWENDEEMYYQNALHRVRFYMNINPYFYMYIMMYYANSGKLQEICKGVTIKHLTRTTLLTLLFPVPPQNESLNIINKILEFDSLLQGIECEKTDISYLVSSAKSKILDLAIRGKLVSQDPIDEPASVLLERIHAEKEELIKQGKIKRDKKESIIFKGDDNSYYEKFADGKCRCIDDELPFDLPNGWEWCNLSMIGTTNIGLTYRPTDVDIDGTMILRSSNIVNDQIDLNDLVRVKSSIRDSQYIQANDILICVRNGSKALVGKCALIDVLKEPASFGAFMAIYRTPYYQYVLHYLRSGLFRRVFDDGNSTAINQLTQDMLKRALIPVPPQSEQIRIVNSIDSILIQLCVIEKSLK